MKNNLAIIIPAYKPDFLYDTLNSIYKQSYDHFNLYIGDDASPHDLYSVIKEFEDKMPNLFYKRFEKNLGGEDLVAHWERCVDLSQSEEWIWLFSDDDIMDRDCVKSFYKELDQNYKYAVYHFDVKVIDDKGQIYCNKRFEKEDFPQIISSEEYIKKRLTYEINSFVVEYIFNRVAFYNRGRFQNFDLAWGSDDATWVKLGKDKGIKTIKNVYVNWRCSSVNITPNVSESILNRKLNSSIEYLSFLNTFLKKDSFGRYYRNYFMHSAYSAVRKVNFSSLRKAIKHYNVKVIDNIPENRIIVFILFCLFRFFSFVRK